MRLKCNLRRVRRAADITQQELSDRTGIHITQISDYENDKVVPTVYTLWKIAIALKCSVDDLYSVVKK
jgi:transcriptional regulator with XRE-family HTH domain